MSRAWDRASLGLAASLAVLLASCAPHALAPPSLDATPRAARYRTLLVVRERHARAARAEVSVWIEGRTLGRMPGASAELALGAPDAFRLRVDSVFGVALDLSGRGDSLTAYLPPRRIGMSLDAVRDSIGLESPGPLVCRLLSASWRPPEASWLASAWQESLLIARWSEGQDSLTLAVRSDGLPVWASLARGRHSIRAEYRDWDRAAGVAWPSLLTLIDQAGTVRITLRLEHLRFENDAHPEWFTLKLPARAERVEWPVIRRALERLGQL